MDSQDKAKFSACMKALAVNASTEISKDALVVYFNALKDLDIKTVEEATKHILLTWEFNRMPPISEIVKFATGSGQIEDRALVMANKIVAHVEVHGASEFPNFLREDPIAAFLMTTRWRYYTWAANVLSSELKWWIREFVEAYRSYEKTGTPLSIEAGSGVKQLVAGIGGDHGTDAVKRLAYSAKD